MECSAATGENVIQSLETVARYRHPTSDFSFILRLFFKSLKFSNLGADCVVARMLSQKVEPREETTVLHKEPQQKKSSGCC